MNEVLKFEWNGKELFIDIYENKLRKGKIENNLKQYELTHDEEEILDYVLKSIAPSKDCYKLRIINFNHKSFMHLMAKNNGLHIFYEIKDKQYVVPQEKDLKILNCIYNNQSEHPTFDQNEDNSYFKRIVKLGKKTLVVLVGVGVCFSILGNKIINKASTEDYTSDYQYETSVAEAYTEETINEVIESTIIDKHDETQTEELQLTYEDVVTLVNENPNLSKDEKALILSNKEYFDDNLKYMDNNHVQTMLQRLRIYYDPARNDDANGVYIAEGYYIILYNSTDFESANKSVFTHEVCHAFAIPPNTFQNFNYGQNTIEVLNVIVNNEYFGDTTDYDRGYNTLVPYGKILSEIVDPEVLKQAYFTTDIPLLENYLKSIIDDDVMIKDLFTSIDTNFYLNKAIYNEPSLYEELNDYYESNNNNILNYLKSFYETKTNESIENNEEFMFLYDKENFLHNMISDYTDNEMLQERIEFYTTVKENKHYFNTNKDNNCTIINICTGVEQMDIPVDETELQIATAEGLIIDNNGQYIINDEYQSSWFFKDGMLYTKFNQPVEYQEYSLKSGSLDLGISR